MIRNMLMIAVTALLVACAAAYDMPPADRAAMEARIDRFEADFAAGRAAGIVDVVPPKVTARLAARAGETPAQLRRRTIKATRSLTNLIKVQSYTMATDQAQFRQTSTGRGYALIPTQTVIRSPSGQIIQSNSTTLAFADAGVWYLVRIDEDAQRNLLVGAYPEFKGLSVRKGTQKVIG